MATLAIHGTIEVLVKTISDLEVRTLELKKVANTLAASAGLDAPYLGVLLEPPARPTHETDFGRGPSSDAQD